MDGITKDDVKVVHKDEHRLIARVDDRDGLMFQFFVPDGNSWRAPYHLEIEE